MCPRFIYVHLFIDGILMTFLGVWLITSNRLPAERLLLDEDELPHACADPDDEYAAADGVHLELPEAPAPPGRLGLDDGGSIPEEHTFRAGLPSPPSDPGFGRPASRSMQTGRKKDFGGRDRVSSMQSGPARRVR